MPPGESNDGLVIWHRTCHKWITLDFDYGYGCPYLDDQGTTEVQMIDVVVFPFVFVGAILIGAIVGYLIGWATYGDR